MLKRKEETALKKYDDPQLAINATCADDILTASGEKDEPIIVDLWTGI